MAHKIITKYIASSLVLIAAFLCMSWLSFTSPHAYTAPDENVNLYFTDLYSKTGRLSYREPLNKYVNGYAHPRNAASKKDKVVPGGFSGFYIILGSFGSVIPSLVFYITPLFAVAGVLFTFLLTRLLFNEKTAFIASFLAATSATYLFWSSRSMFNNIIATTLFIGGTTFTFYAIHKKEKLYYILAGLFFGLDAFVRLTDITFLIPIFVIVLLYRKNIKFKYLIYGSIAFIVSLLPALILNKNLYGGYLSSGYADATTNTSLHQSHLTALLHKLSFFLLPSGFHPRGIVGNASTYLFFFAPLLFGLAIISLVLYRKNINVRNYGIFFILITAWILAYYGSGKFYGSQSFTMDSSFTRYFLPIYILVTPLAASQIARLNEELCIATLVVVAFFSLHLFFYGQDGILQIKQRRESTSLAIKDFDNTTEDNSVIFTSLADKYIFPNRKVVAYGPYLDTNNLSKNKIFTEGNMANYLKNLNNNGSPTYLYNDRNDYDFNYVEKLLNKNGLELQPSSKISNLYKVRQP
jgi:hypothetical protein